MRIQKIVLENFGPYHGKHELDLRVTENSPVVLIHGENERGKTSLANALRWCLYRKVFESDGARIATFELMNWEALGMGAYNMAVRVEFEHEGCDFVLERRVQAQRQPTADTDLDWHESLRKDGNVQASSAIERTVRDILPAEISQFFLFDGEMLNLFKVLLRDPGRNSQLVKQSIEQILGVPALHRASVNLETLRRSSEQRQLQEARARRSHEKVIQDAQQKQDQLDALERDVAHQKEIQQRLQKEKEDLREKRNQFAEIQADLRRLDELEAQVKAIDDEKTETKEAMREILSENWWMPLEKIIAAEFDKVTAKDHAESGVRARKIQVESQLATVREASEAGMCSLCGHKMGAEERTRLKSAEANLEEQLRSLIVPRQEAGSLEAILHLRPFASQPGHKLLVEKEMQGKKLSIQQHRVEREIREIRDRVQTDARPEIADIERQYDQCVAQLLVASASLNDTIAKQRDTAASLQRLQAQIRALPDANRKLAAEAAVFGALKSICDAAIATFRDRLRVEVEKQAKDVHAQLTTEPQYSGLKINDQYGLMLVNAEGRDILRRSAGSEQVVALALIAALNHAAGREAPVMMDTPLGRLDRGHRANILRFAARFAPQVILLVQSGELDRDRDLTDLMPFLAHEYRIERVGASDRSKFSLVE